jgi:hypothetical protein
VQQAKEKEDADAQRRAATAAAAKAKKNAGLYKASGKIAKGKPHRWG